VQVVMTRFKVASRNSRGGREGNCEESYITIIGVQTEIRNGLLTNVDQKLYPFSRVVWYKIHIVVLPRIF